MTSISQTDGIRVARTLKRKLLSRGLPVRKVFLFGSVARNSSRKTSDIDIAIICDPFGKSHHEENVSFLILGHEIDDRVQTVCLHPDDFENRYSTLSQEIRRYGMTI
jgi:predicted nucleotidyltransferase